MYLSCRMSYTTGISYLSRNPSGVCSKGNFLRVPLGRPSANALFFPCRYEFCLPAAVFPLRSCHVSAGLKVPLWFLSRFWGVSHPGDLPAAVQILLNIYFVDNDGNLSSSGANVSLNFLCQFLLTPRKKHIASPCIGFLASLSRLTFPYSRSAFCHGFLIGATLKLCPTTSSCHFKWNRHLSGRSGKVACLQLFCACCFDLLRQLSVSAARWSSTLKTVLAGYRNF